MTNEEKKAAVRELRAALLAIDDGVNVGARSAGNELTPNQVRTVLTALIAVMDALAALLVE